MRVLVLEDDVVLRRAFVRRLQRDGHAVDSVVTLASAREALEDVAYDCLVLDRRVPDGDALALVAEHRSCASAPPVLLVSGLDGASDRVSGLREGADDYLCKPVSLEELALRVRNLLIRRRAGAAQPPLRLGRVTVNRARSQVELDGVVVPLPRAQYTVLAHLAEHRDRVVPTVELIARCVDPSSAVRGNPLPPHISRLRRRFDGALRVRAVRGRGYQLEVEGAEAVVETNPH